MGLGNREKIQLQIKCANVWVLLHDVIINLTKWPVRVLLISQTVINQSSGREHKDIQTSTIVPPKLAEFT